MALQMTRSSSVVMSRFSSYAEDFMQTICNYVLAFVSLYWCAHTGTIAHVLFCDCFVIKILKV